MNNLATYDADCRAANAFRKQEAEARKRNPERRAEEEVFKGANRWLDDEEE